MSQEKVDLYKKSKAARKSASAKENRARRLEIGVFLVIVIAALAWFIGSVAVKRANSVVTHTTVDTAAVNEYLYNTAE